MLERFRRTGGYECRAVELPELEKLRAFVSEAFETDEITPLDTMRRLYEKNREILHVLVRTSPNSAENGNNICGYFCVFPLTRAASKLVQAEALTGDKIGPDQIVRTRSRASAFYIGGIAASGGRYPSARVIAYLEARLSKAVSRAIPIYTRPVTKEGLRLMKRHSFQPVRALGDNQDGLGRIHIYTRTLR
jgi:hypothetical protein